jgi:hypothetical protein
MPIPQQTYRVYSFDLARKLVTADFITAANDEEAIAAAEGADFGHKCEIWHNRRLVAQLEAERRQA